MPQAPAATIAYYTVLEDERTGWTGGLLLLNQGGRPLEFQCTLPVRPTRAHEILYGVTLRQHLIGEVIGPLLIEKCRNPISLLCCDQSEARALAAAASFPIATIGPEPELAGEHELAPDTAAAFPTLTAKSDAMRTVWLAGSPLVVADTDLQRVEAVIAQLSDLPDAVEPFERIREAIKEAQSQIARAPVARPASAA